MKKATKIIIAIVAILVVLGAAAAGLFFTGMFDYLKPTRKTWSKQVQKALDLEGVKITDYSDYLEEYKEMYKKPFTSKFNITADLSISELDEDVQKTINNSKITMETSSIPEDSYQQLKVSLETDKSEVLELDTVINGSKVGIGSKDIYDKYLAVSIEDLEEYINKNSSDSDLTSSSEEVSKLYEGISKLDTYELLYISEDDLKDLQETYKDAFNDAIDKKSYTKKANVKVEVDGKDVKATGFYLTLSGEEIYDLVKDLSKTVKDDDTLAKLITDKANIVLEAIGEDKIESKDAKELLENIMDELLEEVEYEFKEYDDRGIQIAVYSKLGKPVRLEVNYVEDMDDIYDTTTYLSIEYGKKKDIYTILPEEKNSVTIIDEYEKKSDEERKGTLTIEYRSTKIGTVDYEFVNKKTESKLALNANVPMADLKANVEISAKGNYKKEPVEVLISVDGTYGEESAKIKIEGTIDYTADVSIPTLSSSNSVDVLKLSEKEQEELMDEILKKASEVLPDRLKLIGVNIDAKDIYSPKKSTSTTSTSMSDADEMLVAKKAEEDSTFGKYTEIIEIGFKNDKIVAINVAMEFDDEETAASLVTILKMADEDDLEGYDISQDGKKIVMSMDAKTFMEQEGLSDEDLSKDALKKALEEEGYTVE